MISSSDISQELDIIVKAGDSFSRSIAAKNPDTSDYNFASHSARMQIKKSVSDFVPVLSLTVGSGITLSTGSIVHSATASQMQLEPREYVYDLEVVLPSGNIQTWLKGKFIVNGDVTRV